MAKSSLFLAASLSYSSFSVHVVAVLLMGQIMTRTYLTVSKMAGIEMKIKASVCVGARARV
jgi:hypothetical protein